MESSLRPYPKYGNNHIEERLAFDMDKHSKTFGRPYYYTKEHQMHERNKFLYKLASDLDCDSVECASHSDTSYSALSYTSNFADYYGPMPSLYKDINEECPNPESRPPQNYGFVKYNPPFEKRSRDVRDCAAMLRVVNEKLLPGERKAVQMQKANNVPTNTKMV